MTHNRQYFITCDNDNNDNRPNFINTLAAKVHNNNRIAYCISLVNDYFSCKRQICNKLYG